MGLEIQIGAIVLMRVVISRKKCRRFPHLDFVRRTVETVTLYFNPQDVYVHFKLPSRLLCSNSNPLCFGTCVSVLLKGYSFRVRFKGRQGRARQL
jgi:hypothetical protein